MPYPVGREPAERPATPSHSCPQPFATLISSRRFCVIGIRRRYTLEVALRMTNSEIRAHYLARVAEISKLNQDWIAEGVSLRERALRAWQIRHVARLQARSMMENYFESEDLRERDRRLYGNPEGPTFDQLVQQSLQHGLQQDEAYQRIISGSQTTNREVNKLFDPKRPLP
jgi:hypothetical protein